MTKKKKNKRIQIDNIPKYKQQPRSTFFKPKPRTDFSIFSSPSFHPQGSLLGSRGKYVLSTVITVTMGDKKEKKNELPAAPLVRCKEFLDEGQGFFSNMVEVPVVEAESSAHRSYFHSCNDGNADKQKGGTLGTLELSPDKSEVTEGSEVCVTPGSIVWARTSCQTWWPAEIMGERSTLSDSSSQNVGGLILVQYYGNHESAWVDPATDLSQFDNCFQERSCNPEENFQDALKQALHQKKHQSSCRQLFGSPDGPTGSNQQEDQSYDKWNSSSSSRIEGECHDRGRGKRKPKPKVHFDEVTFPLKSAKKLRRYRIMRYLGLSAPTGSPFKNCFESF